LIRIKKLGDIEDIISKFQVLAIRVDDISDEKLLQSYMGGSKEENKHELLLRHPKNVMEAIKTTRHIQENNKDTHKYTNVAHTWSIHHLVVHKTIIPQPKRLTPQQIDEIREKGL
jgi:hypothetical protein